MSQIIGLHLQLPSLICVHAECRHAAIELWWCFGLKWNILHKHYREWLTLAQGKCTVQKGRPALEIYWQDINHSSAISCQCNPTCKEAMLASPWELPCIVDKGVPSGYHPLIDGHRQCCCGLQYDSFAASSCSATTLLCHHHAGVDNASMFGV